MSRKATIGVLLLFIAMIALWLAFPQIVRLMVPGTEAAHKEWESRGAFGDSFGVFNSLISALALCGVLVTLYMQSIQLRTIQRQEAQLQIDKSLQIRLLASTAALNYYNAEADRLQALMLDLAVSQNEHAPIMKIMAAKSHAENLAKRSKLITDLEALMSGPSDTSAATDAPHAAA